MSWWTLRWSTVRTWQVTDNLSSEFVELKKDVRELLNLVRLLFNLC